MCYTYDKSKGGDTRELQSRIVPPQKKLGRVTLRPIDLEHSLSQSPNFGTNYLTTYAHLSPFKHKLKTYLFKNYYFSH